MIASELDVGDELSGYETNQFIVRLIDILQAGRNYFSD